MGKTVKTAACASVIAAALFALLYRLYGVGLLLSLAIAFATTGYHFTMRLLVGGAVNAIMHNRADYYKKWFQPRRFEPALYRFLNVRKWKNWMPTYSPEMFSLKKHSPDEIAQAMCQSEIVHEIIAVLSFLPVAAILRFGSPAVFISTSTAAACFDLSLVIVQRYNRPRAVRIAERMRH